jgi:hypothetical protein
MGTGEDHMEHVRNTKIWKSFPHTPKQKKPGPLLVHGIG